MKKALIITLLLLGQQSLAMNGETEEDQQGLQRPLIDQWAPPAPVVPAPQAGEPVPVPLLEQWMPVNVYEALRDQARRDMQPRVFTIRWPDGRPTEPYLCVIPLRFLQMQ